MATVILDAGHGGSDSGAVYNGRQEKDDALRLAMAVGRILENEGVNVEYTRTSDVYDTPFQKAMEANNMGGDLFVSIHRNSNKKVILLKKRSPLLIYGIAICNQRCSQDNTTE